MYPTWLERLMFYFDLCGLCTQFKSSPRQFNFDSLVLILHMILATVFTVFTFLFLKRPIQDSLGIFNDAIKLYALLLVYWLSIFDSYSKRKTQKKFWQIIEQIDQRFCSHRHVCFKSYIIKLIVYFFFLAIFLMNYIWHILPGSELHYFWFFFTSFYIFFNIRLFYYLFFLEFIKHELKIIDHEVSEILNTFERNKLKGAKEFMRKFHRNRFKWFREFYGCIYDLCNIINSVCGWSNVAVVPLPFLLLLTDINWFYWKILNVYEIDIVGK